MFLGSNIHIGNMSIFGGAGDGETFFLDNYPAFAAYSVQKLSGTSTDCMDVRRSSDDAVATIGFSSTADENGNYFVDGDAIATHCTTNGGFVDTLYEQSGGVAGDAVQASTTNQPQIYDGSATIKLNGKPTLYNDGARTLATASAITVSQPVSSFIVGQNTLASGSRYAMMSADSSWLQGFNASEQLFVYAGTLLTSTNTFADSQWVYTMLADGATSKGRINGTEEASGNAGTNGFDGVGSNLRLLGNGTTSIPYGQTFLMYDSDQTANFSAIEAEMGTAFLSRHTVTANGNAQVNGSNGLVLDGTGDYIGAADSADWTPTGAFTIGAHVTTNTTMSGNYFFSHLVDGNQYFQIQFTSNTNVRFELYSFGSVILENFTISVTNGVRTYIAFTWDGSNIRCYQDGTQVGGDRAYASTFPNFGAPMNIGRNQFGAGSGYFDGTLERYHIVNGTALWTGSTHTVPPVDELITLDSNTVLALNFPGDNGDTFIKDSAQPDGLR